MTKATQNRKDYRARLSDRVRSLVDGLDNRVSMTVVDSVERRRHAIFLGWLIAAGLACTIASPILTLLQAETPVVVAPLVAAALLLAAAAWLSLTGALEVVAWLGGTLALAAFGGFCQWAGGVSPGLLIALAIVPAEALVRGRTRLATALGASAAVIGFFTIGEAQQHLTAADAAAATLTMLHGATLAVRAAAGSKGAASLSATSGTAPTDFCRPDVTDEPCGTSVRLSADGAVLAFSPSAALFFGGGEAAALRRPFIDLVHVADRIACLRALKADDADGDVPIVARLRRASGHHGDAALTVRRDAAGGFTVRFAPLPMREGEGATQTLKAALEQATQSSSAKTQFLAAVSHELRTPLNAIIGFSDILGQEIFGGFETDRQKEYVGLIRQSGQHLLSVVNGLLDVSKIEAGRYELEPEGFVFGQALSQAADIVRDEASAKKLRLDLRAGCAGARIVADRRACHQILLNLLSNAVKFTDVGVVTLESRVDGDFLQVSVSDTGIGIASEDVERLGRPFTQVSSGTARRYAGTGLGLSLVKGLAELHGGTMAISSQPSIGTMVTVRLPIDCTAIVAAKSSLTENIVALDHARTKTPILPQTHAPRRTA